MELDFAIRASGGVLRTALLGRCGMSTADIRRAAVQGALARIRHGWYFVPGADDRLMRAVRSGGVLTCVSALRMHGAWVPESSELHVRLTEHGRRSAQLCPGVQYCGRGEHRPPRALDSLRIALQSATDCVSPEELVAIMDSLLHTGRLTRSDLADLFSHKRAGVLALIESCDPRAESGTESLVRYRLTRRGLALRPQVQVVGVGRVDLMIGRRLVVEVDSRTHHGGNVAYTRDRTRDRLLAEKDYVAIRLTYHQVLHEWPEVERSILAVVQRDAHRRPPRTAR